MKKIIKIITISSANIVFNIYNAFYANAAILSDNGQGINENVNNLNKNAGFEASTNLGVIMQYVIQAFLSLLGIIFVVLMLYAGYNWMTAAGDEQKVEKAKDTLTRAIIGIIITVSAYAITYFVFKYLDQGSGWGATAP